MNDRPPLLARFGSYQLDEGNARLSLDDRPVDLPPKAFAVLCELVRRAGQLVLKEELLDSIWGHQHISESVLKNLVSQIRNALVDDARQPRFIETASRRGYRFIAALSPAEAPVSAVVPMAAPAHASPGLIGRDGPLELLQRCLSRASSGKPQVMLLAGEAGIGKSTLIERFVTALPPLGVVCSTGQCVEHYGSGEPYMPVLEAVNALCRGDSGASLVELMRRVAPSWVAQLPWLLEDDDRRQLQREVAGASQDRMLREFGELLARFTAGQPLLLVLEDMHWSDRATVQLVDYIARRRGGGSVMVLASFRPAEVIAEEHPLADMRQELRLHQLCQEIDLETFSEAEVAALLAGRLGDDAPEDFVRELHAHTGGLPLFVTNLLDELAADGSLRQEHGRWRFPEGTALTVPRNVAGVIEKQIRRLGDEQQQWLGAASVAGAEFLHLPLADALRVEPDVLRNALDAAASRQQWVRGAGVKTLPDGRLAARYAFRHALYRHVFYQRLGEAQRTQWHRQLAASLQAAHGQQAAEIAAELAMHLERGQQPAAAIEQLRIVAARALARSAGHEAVQAARHGLGLLERLAGEGPARAGIELDLRVLEAVGLSRQHVLSKPEVAAAFERAGALVTRVDDSPARARALHGLWWVTFARGEMAQARGLAQRIVALARGSDDVALQLTAGNAMGMTLTMMGEYEEARRHLEASVDGYARIGGKLPPGMTVQDPGVEALAYLALVSWWLGEPGLSRRLAGEAVALAGRIRHPISQVIAHQVAAALHFFADDVPQVLKSTERIYALIRSGDVPATRGGFGWLHGHALVRGGHAEEGLAEMRDAERSCLAIGFRVGLTGYHRHHAEACRELGQLDAAQASVREGLAQAEARQERCHLSALHRLHAELLQARGETSAAKEALQRAVVVAAETGARYYELHALVSGTRLPGFMVPALRDRMGSLVASFGDDPMTLLREAREALAREAHAA
jgi:DNA-binding winged helix-turn-helix (wHTH) protein/tetratricopeptide (TPR) repeat protein